jgi:transposase
MLEERAAQGLPPKSTVYGYLDLWNWDGTLERIHHVLCVAVRKRHILVDTLGLLLSVAVHSASIQDRDGVERVLDRCTRRLFPFIERIYGDGGYRGPKAATGAAKTGRCKIVIVARPTTALGFEVVPKRWIVERTFAWINCFRRLVRDFERYARTVAAFIRLAMIRIMLRRLVANPSL